MAITYKKLTKENLRNLPKGGRIVEHGIVYDKLQSGDGTFTVNLMVDGTRIKRAVGRESDGVTRTCVEEVIEKLRTEARENRLNLPKGRKLPMKFKEATEKYISNLKLEGGKNIDRKEQQIRDYLNPFFKDFVITQIASFDIERYKKYWTEKEISTTTVNRHLAVLSHIFNKLVEWKIIDHVPCKIKKFKEIQGRITYLTSEQAANIIEKSKEEANLSVYPFIFIGLETAMRRMEILSIQIKHIDLDKKMIYIPEAKAGSRQQPFTNRLAQFLKGYLKTIDNDQPFLFPSKTSKSGHVENIEKAFRRVITAAGLDPKEIVRHTLRHTAITHLVQAGVDLPTVKRISGHKTLQMVERYSHQNGEHIREAMNKLEQRYTVKEPTKILQVV